MAEPGTWWLVAGIAAASVAIRLLPELWLRGRAPPKPVADALPWLPVCVAGTLLGVLHVDAPRGAELEYLAAAGLAGATLLWRRSFYLPIVVGALTLAAWRALSG